MYMFYLLPVCLSAAVCLSICLFYLSSEKDAMMMVMMLLLMLMMVMMLMLLLMIGGGGVYETSIGRSREIGCWLLREVKRDGC
jgi:hypothetical protein